jgi:hypothetical protein
LTEAATHLLRVCVTHHIDFHYGTRGVSDQSDLEELWIPTL